jgi:DNA-binding winged helix-turn-helix (wHTH) protein
MRIHFGRFVLDTGRAQLFADGQEKQLTPKAFGVLCLLLDRRPDVVDKDTIAETVWGAPVSDASLTMVMTELRKALGDQASAPVFIRTAHRRGYAFSGRAEPVSEPIDDAQFVLVIDGKRISLAEGETIAGRDENCAIWIDEPTVSRWHARFVVSGDTVSVEDLKSTNGVRVNGRRKSGVARLQAGDLIKIGGITARLDAPHAPKPGKTVRLPGR